MTKKKKVERILTHEEIQQIKELAAKSEAEIIRQLINQQQSLLSYLKASKIMYSSKGSGMFTKKVLLSDNKQHNLMDTIFYGFVEGPQVYHQEEERIQRIIDDIQYEINSLQVVINAHKGHLKKFKKTQTKRKH